MDGHSPTTKAPSPFGRYVHTRAGVRGVWSAISPHPNPLPEGNSIYTFFFALKGRSILAQGNALGNRTSSTLAAPQGARERRYLALTGRLFLLWLANPGRRGVPLALG